MDVTLTIATVNNGDMMRDAALAGLVVPVATASLLSLALTSLLLLVLATVLRQVLAHRPHQQ